MTQEVAALSLKLDQIFVYMTQQEATENKSPMTKTPEDEGKELDPSTQDQMDEEMAPATPGTMHDKDYTSTDSQRGSLSSTKEKNETTDG